MVNDLQRIESDRAIILAGISHDLRTPLARMLLEVEMANLSDDARTGMQSDLAQMDGIIGQFLNYAKPTDTSSFERINLSELIDNVAQTATRQTDVRIQSSITPNVHVFGNETELRRVLENLLENSRRYGKKDGDDYVEIDIDCHIRQDKVIVNIADHGAGVPDSEIDRLLRPFTRLDVARGQANGSGLGLAIVSRIVKQHGGKLRVSNREGGGLATQIELQLKT
jgi:two-component system osmolarity sensor histidine kinase EnvZ